ncbi:CocE/NonD family hydrolase [Streptomyces sp. NPDC006368]|uniref:CocE/NonD family hydrolase n=1 Tax=Streptomyces sp. NPDC006368 TaxID=3156760 RepID=UPI0033BE0F08
MTTTVRIDGLATDVCLPPTPATHPAVVIRTPYDRRHHRAELRGWAARGFAALAQDVRGRHGSPGDWQPYGDHEKKDGETTLHWLRAQPWSNGQVVTAGASYAAYCALAVADLADAVIAAVPALGLAETARERTGPERLQARAGWWSTHGASGDPAPLDHLPVTGILDHPSWRALWRARRRDLPAAEIPLLAVGGTRDPFAGDTVELWRHWPGPARLLLGPWGHRLTAEPAPEARPAHRVDLGALYTGWARAALAGTLAGRTGAVALGGSDHWCPAGHTTLPTRHTFGTGTGPRLVRGAAFVAHPDHPVRSDDLNVSERGVPDRCLLVTPPLARPLDLLGPAEARLDATADAPSADWAVRLVALDPAGRADPLTTGIVRRTRPGPFTVPLGHLARRLPAGTRVRLEVAGHHFPAHARNPHTGEDPVTATRLEPSHRTVRMRGSALCLPVVRGVPHIDPVQEIQT